MLAKRIIPCLDCDRGRVVKGVKFFDHIDAGDPLEQAIFYDQAGADELVFYDITASFEGRGIMAEVVRKVADSVFMPITVGGGIRSLDDATQLIQAGAEKVSLNSAAVKNPQLIHTISRKFGRCATVLGLDANRVVRKAGGTSAPIPPIDQLKGRPIGRVLIKMGLMTRQQVHKGLTIQVEQKIKGISAPLGQILVDMGLVTEKDRNLALAAQVGDEPAMRQIQSAHAEQSVLPARRTWEDENGAWEEVWEVFINGGRVGTGVDVLEWTREAERLGAGEIVLNVMNADGTRAGYDLEMTRAVSQAVHIPVVASGGAGQPEHLLAVLTEGQADAALAASIFHFREHSVPEVKKYLNNHGVHVRLL